MKLTRVKLGSLVSLIDERNTENLRNFYGINIYKNFMPTVANIENINESRYKIVRKNRFVFSGMQTGRDECIRISMYNGDTPIVVSPAYITFEVTNDDIIPEYFFMFFLSREKDRLGWFYSDSSVRSNLDWERFCEIDISLPPLAIQQKYVNVYKSLLANQKAYEQGLEDLKLVCDAYIEKQKSVSQSIPIGPFLEQKNKRNSDNKNKNVMGLSTLKDFRIPQSRVNKEELSNYKIVQPKEFAFVPTTDTWKVFAFGLNNFGKKIVVSPIYEVFRIKDESMLLPEYLSMWFKRKEFDRYVRFHSWGSARENFTWYDLRDVKIPIPPLSVQQSIVNIYKVLQTRRKINEQLKEQVKSICPILIKGSLEETERL